MNHCTSTRVRLINKHLWPKAEFSCKFMHIFCVEKKALLPSAIMIRQYNLCFVNDTVSSWCHSVLLSLQRSDASNHLIKTASWQNLPSQGSGKESYTAAFPVRHPFVCTFSIPSPWLERTSPPGSPLGICFWRIWNAWVFEETWPLVCALGVSVHVQQYKQHEGWMDETKHMITIERELEWNVSKFVFSLIMGLW